MSIVLAGSILALTSAHALTGHHTSHLDSGYASRPGQVRVLGTYSTNHAEFHAQENGKLWNSRALIGPDPTPRTINHETPGPLAYGVPEDDRTVILVRVGMTSFGISPWQRIEGRALRRLEDARLKWLNDNGYGSGVRTFVNDAYAPRHEHAAADLHQLPVADSRLVEAAPVNAREIQPRATIRIPADMPRFRKRMEVRRTVSQPAVVVASDNRTGGVQVNSITGRGNSGTPTLVVPKAVAVASAQ
jgi:hypothetical protein